MLPTRTCSLIEKHTIADTSCMFKHEPKKAYIRLTIGRQSPQDIEKETSIFFGNIYHAKSLNALLLDRLHSLEELDVVQRVRVLDEAAHQQVEVLGRHDHADVVQDARKVRERDASVVFRHLGHE